LEKDLEIDYFIENIEGLENGVVKRRGFTEQGTWLWFQIR